MSVRASQGHQGASNCGQATQEFDTRERMLQVNADAVQLLRTNKLKMTLKIVQRRGWTYRANVMIACTTGVPMNSISLTRQMRSRRVSNLEKAKILHEYAESNIGEFPKYEQVHPEYPEWKWGRWVRTVLRAYFSNSLDENVKGYIESSVHWKSKIEKLKQGRESRVGQMPIPEHYEKAKLLHEYAESNKGEFPKPNEVYPEYPEWKWGRWVNILVNAYIKNGLGENTKAYMEGSVYWRSKIEQRKKVRESRIGQMPIPEHYEKAKLLHEYAESNEGQFPTRVEVHPEYPEWKWGSWVRVLLQAYFANSLDANTKAYMEGSVYWRSRIEQLKKVRESKVGKMPNPENCEKAKLLHEYAESNEGQFPTQVEVHPEYSEWRWGGWVYLLLQAYFANSLDEDTKTFMEGSVYWRSKIEQIKQIRKSREGKMPIPEHHEKAKLLHEYAESNKGQFPKPNEVYPEYPEWKWGSWVNILLNAYIKNRLGENTKVYMEGSVYWRSRVEQLRQERERRVGKMPNPEHHEKAMLLHEYAESNKGQFPKPNEVHPEYPEWKWGNWVNLLLQAYFNSSLDENTKVYMEGSVYWRPRIEQLKQERESRVGKMPIPENYEKAMLLHEYAESNKGEFPKGREVHPEYPGWKWGEWVRILLQAYFENSLDANVKASMDASVHWRSRIDKIKEVRESKVGKMPNPENCEKAKLLHEYAESNEGEFPKPNEVHPEYPEWKWGSWVYLLLDCYLRGIINQETIDVMEASPYWRSRITGVIARRRERTWSPPPKPPKPKQARMLHVYAENNGGTFPTADEIHPEFPEWRRLSWVENLVNDYLIDALDYETRKILDSSIHWKAKIQERREQLKHIHRRLVDRSVL